MKISKTKFVILFLVAVFIFQFISNSLLGSEVRLFPARNESFLKPVSSVAWKNTVSTILLPLKIVLIAPLLPLTKMDDLPPPFLAISFAFYWTVLALIIYYLFRKLRRIQ